LISFSLSTARVKRTLGHLPGNPEHMLALGEKEKERLVKKPLRLFRLREFSKTSKWLVSFRRTQQNTASALGQQLADEISYVN
jgi:hypothetical protein